MNSEQTNEIAAALAKAQGAMTNAKYNKVNPHFKNKYADLAAIIDAIRAPFADNGVAYSQITKINPDGTFVLVTCLLHTSGQWVESEYPLPYMPDKPQVMGAAMTYARRYELAAISGISAEEDNDANGVAEATAEATRQAAKKPPQPKPDIIQGVEFHGPHVNAPPHDPKTGEIMPDDVADTTTEIEPSEIPIQDMAREAAQRGREVMRHFYDKRSKADKAEMKKIWPELEDLMDAADAALQGEVS